VKACYVTLENILANLRHIEDTSTEIALRSPEQLNLRALEQLSDRWRDEVDRVLRGIQAVKQQEENRVIVPPTFAEAGLSNLCPNAVLYRNDQCHFDKVAVFLHRDSGIQEWACRLCGTIVSNASMPLTLERSGGAQVYITPVGFFKGHSARNGEGTWSCIEDETFCATCKKSTSRVRETMECSMWIFQQMGGNRMPQSVAMVSVLLVMKCGW
jgi:hypothetical protein